MMASFPLISLVIFLPLAGALACYCQKNPRLVKWIAAFFAAVEFIATLVVLYRFEAESENLFQLIESHDWIPSLHIQYLVGVDGIAVLFLPLSALLTLASIAVTWNSIHYLPRFHLALLLALEGVTMGVFTALDLALFYLFWELMLPPIFFLIGLWGIGAERRSAAMKYTLYMLFGGVPLLFGIIILAMNHADAVGGTIPQDLVFSLPVLLETPVPDQLQTLVFALLFTGFVVKTPLAPFHTWLPTASMEGPAHMTALITGLKLGAFGLIRFAMPLAPSAAVEYSWLLGILGAITLIYGGLIALHQSNLRRVLAYASISHVGLVVVGISTLTMQGIQGAIYQLLNFTLSASSLMLVAGLIQYRIGSTEAIHLGGLAKVMPRLTFFYFIFLLASLGVPGTSGFPAELLMVIGALNAHPSLGITALAGAVLGAAYMLSMSRRVFFGPIIYKAIDRVQDVQTRELTVLCLPTVLIILLGLVPNTVLHINAIAAEAWLNRLLNESIAVNEESKETIPSDNSGPFAADPDAAGPSAVE